MDVEEMNTRVKGWKARRKAIEELEAAGYEVAVVERTGKFIKVKDMFGLFDLVAICSYGMNIKFIQVTCNKPHAHKNYRAFKAKYCSPVNTLTLEQWVWMDGKGFKKWVY